MSDPTPHSITALPVLECTILSPSRSTPFASSPLAERFEYPFPITQPLLSIAPALIAALASSTQTLPNGSIVPPTGTGRGMSMSSFASFSAPIPTAALAYPSATASASQALSQTLLGNALLAEAAGFDNHHYTAAQLCVLASANSPMPPSLALKQHGLNASARRSRRRGSTGSDSGVEAGVEGIPKL